MVQGRLRQGRVSHLAQIAQRQIGIALAQVAKDCQGVRKRVAQTPLFELIDQRKLMLGGTRTSGLIGQFGIHATVYVVLNQFDRARFLDLGNAALGANQL